MAARASLEGSTRSDTRTALVLLALLIFIAILADLAVVPKIGRVEPRGRMPVLSPGAGHDPRIPVDLRDRVLHESLDELVEHLTDSDAYEHPMTGVAVFPTDFEDLLRNPRTSKLAASLAMLPPAEAVARARSLCRRFTHEWAATMDVVLRSYEDSSAPKNKRNLSGVKLACGSALYALAHVAEVDAVVEEVDNYNKLAIAVRDRLHRNRDVLPENADLTLARMAILDAPARMTIIATSLERSTSVDPVRRAAAERILAGVPLRRVAYVRWDAPIIEHMNSVVSDEGLKHPPRFDAPGPQGLVEAEIYFWMHSKYFERHGERIVRELVAALATEPAGGDVPAQAVPATSEPASSR